MTSKQQVQQILEYAGVTDLHGAVFVLTKGLSEPLPSFIEQALMEIYAVSRESIICAIGELLIDAHQLTSADLAGIESALKVSRESA
ncbi:hypothetical protein ACLHZU_16305 [Aeromonas salmonicida]|uniref:hypothetical protein n=1 Tax=Aeromonas salmonicida TaxID=645 RepID=UPI003D00A589